MVFGFRPFATRNFDTLVDGSSMRASTVTEQRREWSGWRYIALFAALCAVVGSVHIFTQSPPPLPEPSRIFSRWTDSTPGCAMGVQQGTNMVLSTASGMADLEHG